MQVVPQPARLLVFFLLSVAAFNQAWAADGRILSFEGDVRVNGQPVTATTVLNRADTIVTSAGASVRIVLADNSVLDLDSESEIALSDYSYSAAEPDQNKSEVSVVEGTLRYVSGLIAKEDPDDIGFTAGNSTIGVRGSFTQIEVDGAVINVEAMIGEATLQPQEDTDKKGIIVVPTGKTLKNNPSTGEVVVETTTTTNTVNAVVHAIAAAAPDDSNSLPTDEGCSAGPAPKRNVAHPDYDAATATALSDELAGLSEGELIMVIAVMINNARHLCIDTSTIASTINLIASVRPDVAAKLVFVATLLDPTDADLFTQAAIKGAPTQAADILASRDAADGIIGGSNQPRTPVTTTAPPKPDIETDIPPGGGVGADPSPE
jgi:hypothetical protein